MNTRSLEPSLPRRWSEPPARSSVPMVAQVGCRREVPGLGSGAAWRINPGIGQRSEGWAALAQSGGAELRQQSRHRYGCPGRGGSGNRRAAGRGAPAGANGRPHAGEDRPTCGLGDRGRGRHQLGCGSAARRPGSRRWATLPRWDSRTCPLTGWGGRAGPQRMAYIEGAIDRNASLADDFEIFRASDGTPLSFTPKTDVGRGLVAESRCLHPHPRRPDQWHDG